MKYYKQILSEIENLKYCYENCDIEDLLCHVQNIYDCLSDSYNIPKIKRVTYLHRNTKKIAGVYTTVYDWIQLIDPYHWDNHFPFSLWLNLIFHEWLHHYDEYRRPDRKDDHDTRFYKELSYLNYLFDNKSIRSSHDNFTYDLLKLKLKHKTSRNTKIHKVCDTIIETKLLRKSKKSYVD